MLDNKKRQIQANIIENKYIKASKEDVMKALKGSNKKNHIALGLLAK